MPAVVQTPGSPGERGAEHWLKSAGERGGRGTAGRGGPFCNLAGAPSSISSENRSEGSSLTHQPGAFSPQPSSPRTHRVERWVGRYGGGGALPPSERALAFTLGTVPTWATDPLTSVPRPSSEDELKSAHK